MLVNLLHTLLIIERNIALYVFHSILINWNGFTISQRVFSKKCQIAQNAPPPKGGLTPLGAPRHALVWGPLLH